MQVFFDGKVQLLTLHGIEDDKGVLIPIEFEPLCFCPVRAFDGLSKGKGPLARGLRMAVRVPCFWVPNRGLFRAEAFHRIGGIKRHDKGEFAADWPWLLHMAILGEFERVPEPLCQKFLKKTSLSKGWDYTPEEYMAVGHPGNPAE